MLTDLRNKFTTLEFQLKAGSLLLAIVPPILIMIYFIWQQWNSFQVKLIEGFLVILVVIATIVYLIAWLFAKRVNTIINSLSEAACQITNGRYGYQIRNSQYKNCSLEFKELCLAFNNMSCSIKERETCLQSRNEYLEEKVASHTTELAALHSELKRQLDNIISTEERYQLLFNSIDEAIFVFIFGPDGCLSNFLEVNDAACKRFGYYKEELLKMSMFDIILPQDRDVIISFLKNFKIGNKTLAFETTYLTKDNKQIPVEVNLHSCHFDNQKLIFCTARDIIAKLLIAEKDREVGYKLKKSQEISALGVMAGSFAHEISQPLNSIKMSASGLQYLYKKGHFNENAASVAEIMEEISEISRQVERVYAIINNIKEFMRRDVSSQMPLSVNEAVDAALKTVFRHSWCQGISLKKEYGLNIPQVYGNQIHIEQIIFNLTSNAVQVLEEHAINGHKEISVATYFKDCVTIEFSDNGPGLDTETMELIFEPLFTTKSGCKNMGLGLSIVKSIVEAMNGKIRVNNKPGGGAVFKIELPPCYRQ